MFIKRLLKYLFWMVILFSIGLTGAYFGMKNVVVGNQVQVPNLVGKDIVSSLEILNQQDLRLKITGEEYSLNIPEKYVVYQQPAAGKMVKTGRDIKVIISRGSELASVPDFTQENMVTVRLKLQEQKLKLGRVVYIHSPKEPEQVVAQDPPPGSHLARGKEISLIVSQGPAPGAYLMPDMIGQPVATATIGLKSMGLEVNEPKYDSYPGLAKGIIISHSPWPGYRVQTGDRVTLVVSR